jgi:hypothetical protein
MAVFSPIASMFNPNPQSWIISPVSRFLQPYFQIPRLKFKRFKVNGNPQSARVSVKITLKGLAAWQCGSLIC